MAFLFTTKKSRFTTSSTGLSKQGLAGVEVMRHLCPLQTRHDQREVLVTEPAVERTNARESVASRNPMI